MGESMLSQVNPLVGIARITPRNPQRKPLTSSCGTLKEEMLRGLFDLLMAKSTIISFLQEFLSSSQGVSRV
jgi:transposase